MEKDWEKSATEKFFDRAREERKRDSDRGTRVSREFVAGVWRDVIQVSPIPEPPEPSWERVPRRKMKLGNHFGTACAEGCCGEKIEGEPEKSWYKLWMGSRKRN